MIYTLARDDMHRTSCGDDIPSLREPPKLGKLASGNPYCGLDKKILVPKNEDFLSRVYEKDIFVFCIKVSKFHGASLMTKKMLL